MAVMSASPLLPRLIVAAFAALMLAAPARAATCQSGSFEQWLGTMRSEAAAAGIGARGQAALAGLALDRKVLGLDRGQKVFRQSFEEFSGRMVPPRLARGRAMMQRHSALLGRIEAQYGVPGAVLVAIWGLETDFGAFNGSFNTIQALATLAYDCRRSEKFQAELLDALRIVDRGDMAPAGMRGAWAGEIGQTQFMPSSFVKYAVDYDGNGRRDLVRSVPDVLASTANYMKAHGWRAGQPWGPGTTNFAAIQEWNKSAVYSRTIAYFADLLAGD